jgi:integrase
MSSDSISQPSTALLLEPSMLVDPASRPDSMGVPPVPATRKRGKRMSRRKGQNPKVRVGRRADGKKYYFFQYWVDVPGKEERKRQTEVIGLVELLTRSEAERRKLDFISELNLNSNDYQIPSSKTFADAVRHYREKVAPRMLRDSTFSVADGRIKNHLEADWSDTPIDHITIDSVNDWAWRKRKAGLSWTTIKDALRTMQAILSAFSKDKKPPFSQRGLEIPKRDKLQMQIGSRQRASFSWENAQSIARHVRTMDGLGEARREQYSTLFILAAASGLRCSELLALRGNDVDFSAGTIRVEESSDQRSAGKIGECKNVAAYRTVHLGDPEGQEAMQRLKRFLDPAPCPSILVFRSKRGGPLLETTILNQGLYPALKSLDLKQAGLHAFRRGCNRRWELAGIVPAVIRQQMGHTTAAMTRLYSGEIPLDQVKAEFSMKNRSVSAQLEKMENEAAA